MFLSIQQWAANNVNFAIFNCPSTASLFNLVPHATVKAFFKVILRLGDNPACIGYVMKNGERGKKRNYINSLAQVERITGYHFFPNLADSIRSQVEDTADEDMW